MTWKVRFERRALKDIDRLGQTEKLRISRFIEDRLVGCEDPREVGEALHGPLANRWKYRVGDYRIIALLEDRVITVTIVRVAHRGAVYR